MSLSRQFRSRLALRTKNGSQSVEFAAALVILVGFVIIPLVDLTIVPLRWMLAQELVNDYARRLALCETLTDSFKTMNADPSLTTRLERLGGVKANAVNLGLRITRVFRYPHAEESIVVTRPACVPPAWLPDGGLAPCSYELELEVKSLISPAVLLPVHFGNVPGLTAPIPVSIKATHEWENRARNPITGSYFLNE